MSAPTAPSEKLDRYIVRLPDGMRDQIKDRARSTGRSMNTEIVQILSAALNPNGNGDDEMSSRKSNEQFMLRLPDGMRDRIGEAADANGRSMTQEIVLALTAHLEGDSRTTDDHRLILAGQALNGILAGPHGPDIRGKVLTDAGAARIALTSVFLADKVLEAAHALDGASLSDEEGFAT